MEAETSSLSPAESQEGRLELIVLLKNTFSAATQKEQREAEDKVMTLMKESAFMRKLYLLLTDAAEIPKKSR